MKKQILSLGLMLLSSIMITNCGSGDEAKKDEVKKEEIFSPCSCLKRGELYDAAKEAHKAGDKEKAKSIKEEWEALKEKCNALIDKDKEAFEKAIKECK